MNYEKIKTRFQSFFIDQNEAVEQEIVCLSIDVKSSTEMLDEIGQKWSLKIIRPFMRECAIILKENINLFENIIYAGDGINAVCYVNEERGIADKIFNVAISINTLQKMYALLINKQMKKIKKEWDFKVGIGIYSGYAICAKIKDMSSRFNNRLFIGDPVSKATKLCNSSKKLENYCIVSDEIFFNLLSKENKKFNNFNEKQNFYISRAYWGDFDQWISQKN